MKRYRAVDSFENVQDLSWRDLWKEKKILQIFAMLYNIDIKGIKPTNHSDH